MATLYIRFYESIARVKGESIHAPSDQVLVGGEPNTTITLTATSTAATAAPANARIAKLSTDTNCQWEKANPGPPTADGNSNFLAANDSEFIEVDEGDVIAARTQV